MTTSNSNQKKTNEVKQGSDKPSKAPLIAFILTTLLFLGASGYLYYNNDLIQKENMAQKLRIDSLNVIKAELDKEVSGFQEEIKVQQGKYQELENMLAAANDEIEKKKDRIAVLARSKASTDQLKKELKELKELKETHLARILELEAQLAALKQENEALKAHAVELDQQIATLQSRNTDLEKKVEVASALKTNNVIVIGEKKSKKGYLPTSLKKAERLLITFDIMENKVAEPGEKNIYITVTNPSGKVLETAESGTFTNVENNVATPYTLVQRVSYSNSEQKEKASVEIKKEERKPGKYTIEFYCDGYLCGVKSLTIK